MTKKQFDKLYVDVAVNCETSKEAKHFIKLAYKFGYKWTIGKKRHTYWKKYGQQTTYAIGFMDTGVIGYANKNFYEKEGLKIIKFRRGE